MGDSTGIYISVSTKLCILNILFFINFLFQVNRNYNFHPDDNMVRVRVRVRVS